MAKRRGNNDEPVSLFPFMSILACLIGILTLMISVSMQAKQMNEASSSDQDKALAIQNRDLKRKASSIEAEIRKADEQLKTQNSASHQIAQLRDNQSSLREKLKKLSQSQPTSEQDINKTIEELRAQMAALKAERPALTQKVQDLTKEVNLRKNPPKKTESVQVRPGTRVAARLFFVECNEQGIIILGDNDKNTTIPTNAIANSPEFKSFLENAKGTRDSIVLFLIRNTGAAAYAWAAGIAETKFEVRVGKLPMPNDGKIDLSVFKPK
jgi:seryl-tRNA synthetase